MTKGDNGFAGCYLLIIEERLQVMKKIKKFLCRQGVAGYILILPFIIGFLCFTLTPFLSSFYLAFTKYDVLTAPKWIGLANFKKMFFEDNKFWISLKVTFKFAIVQVPVKLGFSLLVAMLLCRKTRITGLLRTMFYIPSIMGGSVAVALLWKQLFNYDGVINQLINVFGIESVAWLNSTKVTLYVLILLGVWQFGSSMLIFLAALKNIPAAYYEAAQIDGAGKAACFFKVTLPLITPVLFFNLINQIIGSLQAFNSSFLITSGGPLDSTLYYGLHLYNRAFKYYEMGYGSAMAWFLLVIIGLLTALVFKSSSTWVYYETEVK